MTASFDTLLDQTLAEITAADPPRNFESRLLASLPAAAVPRPTLTFQPLSQLSRSPQSTRSSVTALLLHLAALALFAVLVRQHVRLSAREPATTTVALSVPLPAPPRAQAIGGGGGQRGPTPVSRGHLPLRSDHPLVPPSTPPLAQPKIAVEPTINIQKNLRLASSLPDLGQPNSPLAGLSMGNGTGSGIGSGTGSGLGFGSGGNTGGGPRRIGGGISAPVLLFSVEPEFSEEARRAKVAGNVLVNLWVTPDGHPTHVHVLRGVGMGLDQKAIAAVQQYRFAPALENGKPVLVELNIEVNFQIF